MRILKKIFKIILVIVIFLAIVALFFYLRFRPTNNPVWGINFSTSQASYLGFDSKTLYGQILTDLKPKKVRLMAYWEDIEAKKDSYDFTQTDELLRMSENAGVKVTLVLGHKEPRWPECHQPEWYNNLDTQGRRNALLSMLETSVSHFKTFPAIERWQIENEPLFNYGPDCSVISLADLKQEVSVVKQFDLRPVVTTDSGEKGSWIAAGAADIFGTTMYRKVYSSRFGSYQTYPVPPAWYRIRAGMAETFNKITNVIDVELQAEPWLKGTPYSVPVDEQVKIMSSGTLSTNIAYARATGLPEHYLWGAEWWYWMAKQGHPEFVDAAKKLFNQ